MKHDDLTKKKLDQIYKLAGASADCCQAIRAIKRGEQKNLKRQLDQTMKRLGKVIETL